MTARNATADRPITFARWRRRILLCARRVAPVSPTTRGTAEVTGCSSVIQSAAAGGTVGRAGIGRAGAATTLLKIESWVVRICSAPAWAAQPGLVAASCRLPDGPTRRPKRSRRSEASPVARYVHCCDAPGDWVVAVLVAGVWQGAGALPVGPVGRCGSACLRADVPRGRGSRAEVGPNRDHHPPMQPVPSSTVSNSSFRCRRQPVVDEAGAILLVNPECFTQKVM